MTGTTPTYQKMGSLGGGNVTTLFGDSFPHQVLHQKSNSNYVIINPNGGGTTLPQIGNTMRTSNSSALQGDHHLA